MLDRRSVWILGGSPATQQLLINQTRFWGMVPRATRPCARPSAGWPTAPPDVALVDRVDLDGREALERLAAVPVIELVTLGRRPPAAARPVAALLTKPLKCARLHAHLVSQLGAGAGQAAT